MGVGEMLSTKAEVDYAKVKNITPNQREEYLFFLLLVLIFFQREKEQEKNGNLPIFVKEKLQK